MDDQLRAALEAPNFWHLATVNPDGSPQSTAMWIHTRGDKVVINTALGRKKPRNIDANPNIALSWHDPSNGYTSYAVQAQVVDKIVGDQAEADIDMLAKKYIGEDRYPWRGPDEKRVTFLAEIKHVYRQG